MRTVCSATFSRMTITHKAGFKSPHSFCLFHVTACSPNPTKQKKHLLIHVTGWGVTQRHELSNNVTRSGNHQAFHHVLAARGGAQKRWGYSDSRWPTCASERAAARWSDCQGQRKVDGGTQLPKRAPREASATEKNPGGVPVPDQGKPSLPKVPDTFPTWKTKSLYEETTQ